MILCGIEVTVRSLIGENHCMIIIYIRKKEIGGISMIIMDNSCMSSLQMHSIMKQE